VLGRGQTSSLSRVYWGLTPVPPEPRLLQLRWLPAVPPGTVLLPPQQLASPAGSREPVWLMMSMSSHTSAVM
jgi:hypothetical protein